MKRRLRSRRMIDQLPSTSHPSLLPIPSFRSTPSDTTNSFTTRRYNIPSHAPPHPLPRLRRPARRLPPSKLVQTLPPRHLRENRFLIPVHPCRGNRSRAARPANHLVRLHLLRPQVAIRHRGCADRDGGAVDAGCVCGGSAWKGYEGRGGRGAG